MPAVIGTAGWGIASNCAEQFAPHGSALERYSNVFAGVEINSSFHRPHRASTWARWAKVVPESFQFAVKVPKTITHQAKLIDCEALMSHFAEDLKALGCKLAVLLVQLPPKLAFNENIAERFFSRLRLLISADIACEPRNPSWFEPDAEALLIGLGVARVAADPALIPIAAEPGGWQDLSYWRLHGSPVMYRSSYSDGSIDSYAARVQQATARGRKAWCMFDNTAGSAATANALALKRRLQSA